MFLCFPSSPSIVFVSAIALILQLTVKAEVLYSTDFEDFVTGENNWHGTDGWSSNVPTGGVQSIDDDVILGGGLGKTASIGFNQPDSTFSTVFRSIGYESQDGDDSRVSIEVLLGIQDSTTNFRDSFFVSIYNSTGEFLASVRFANEEDSYGIWRGDSVTESDTGILFIRGELHLLVLRIDLEANLWSADLDELPLFRSATFCSRNDRARNIGPLAFEWQLAQPVARQYGDNWMLVADVLVETTTLDLELNPTDPFHIASINCSTGGETTLTWPGDAGFTYVVEYSADLQTWANDADTPLTANETGTMSYTSAANGDSSLRYYRVQRSSAVANLAE